MKTSSISKRGKSSVKPAASPASRPDRNLPHPDVTAAMRAGTTVDAAMRQAARAALASHAKSGQSIPLWVGGKVVWKKASDVLAQLDGKMSST